jgi:hypothetical protein
MLTQMQTATKMMLKLILVIIAALATHAQVSSELWANRFESAGENGVTDIAVVSASQNVIIAGYFTQPLTIRHGNGSLHATLSVTNGLVANFIVMYSNAGVVQWATRVDKASQQIRIAIAPGSGNLFFQTSITAGTAANIYAKDSETVAESIATTVTTGGACLLIKLSSTGVYQWTVRMESTSGCTASGAVYTGGSLYVSGTYGGTGPLLFYDTASSSTAFRTLVGTGAANTIGFVGSYSGVTGVGNWAARQFSVTGAVLANGIAADSSENVFQY